MRRRDDNRVIKAAFHEMSYCGVGRTPASKTLRGYLKRPALSADLIKNADARVS